MPRRLTALFALLLLAACTGGEGGTPEPAAEEKPGTIVVASGRDVTGSNGVRQRLIDAWNREQRQKATGSDFYQARLVELPGSADEQRSQLLGALQSGSARYDVVNLDVTWVPEFAEAGLVRALPDDLVDADVIGPVAETARWDEKVYAVPFNSDVGLLYYRTDLLRKAGVEEPYVPEGFTWEKLRGHIFTLGEKLNTPDYRNGWTTQLAPYEGRTVNAMEAFATAVPGLRLVDEDGRYTGNVEQLRRGVQELAHRVVPLSVSSQAKEHDETGSTSEFTEGGTAFLRAWPSAYPTLYRVFGKRLGVAPLPGRAVLGGQNLAVTTSSERARKATELIRFLTGRQSERCLLEAGFAATRASAYGRALRCPAEISAAPAPSPTGEADEVPRGDEGRPGLTDAMLRRALEQAVHRPRTPLYGAFTQTLITQLGPLVESGSANQDALARSLDEALRRALPG
ncbi:ABC transporter substrate-binding protein [Streptomyces sp. ZS0098]|uniref:extracellular solute-binding protein n=1 Tax=Streptomyces sp. ZS0098 TaxID=1904044 RepID=UPI000EFACC67|nr:extracellular solute-binding protein [Streptomyces sp. ZS0098]RMI91370.1 ABC transporter substrate-binding protein [Streptomyces sp. ZS0098]